MKVLIAGGSGFIGRHLAGSLSGDGHEVVILSRSGRPIDGVPARVVQWDARSTAGTWVGELNGANGIVNLAGTSIGAGRWTRRRMAEILSSRLQATGALVQAMQQTPAAGRPAVLVNASGIDYYGDRGEEFVNEDSAAGNSFLARVSQQWEGAAKAARPLGVRVVMIRTSLVFGRGALAFRLLTLPSRLFVGGPLGSGRQWFTWIHIDDLVGLYRMALENDRVSGPINAVAPDIRPQREVAKAIGRVLHRPSLIPAPAMMLRLALGDQAQLLLDGRRASAKKAEELGFHFRYGQLDDALAQALQRR